MQLGRKKDCLLTGHLPRVVCFGSSNWWELDWPSPAPAGSHFILMRCFDEEITKDFFFSPNLLPLLTVSLQDHCGCWVDRAWRKGCPSTTGLFWPGGYCPRDHKPGGREVTGSLRTKSRRVHPGAPLTCASPAPAYWMHTARLKLLPQRHACVGL